MLRRFRPLALALPLLLFAVPATRADEAGADAPPASLALEHAPAGLTPPAGLTGFAPESTAAELAREARVAGALRPDSARRHLRLLTEEPHVAGTPADHATAEYVRQRLAAYGWDARIVVIPVWLNYPKAIHAQLLEPRAETLAVREHGIEGDKDGRDANVFDAFSGYGASGDVTGGVVYANYGDVDDFARLASLGIDLHGRIALVRYGKIFRGLKVRNAERMGVAAVIIYSDPGDDGYAVADPYPRGQGRPDDAIQRGSVQFVSESPGDPTTPGWPSTEGGKRLAGKDAVAVPHIPSLPLAYAEARKLLEVMGGPQAPKGWQGGLPFTYHVGPGAAKVHLAIAMDYAVRPIWDVIATLPGREHPEQKVVLGNHRDAWTYGAIDPNSGTICMLELARTIGLLARTGWRPRRTIQLCSWDGEEYGLLGSTEWAEANATDMAANAVAYLNVDGAVSGREFRAGASHALRDVLMESVRDVRDPATNRPLWNVVADRAWSDGRADWQLRNRARRARGAAPRPFELGVTPLGSGSDYTAFLDHLGVPSADMGFGGVHGTYHSMYDDFDYYDRVVDPGCLYNSAMSELWSRASLRLADAAVLPLRYSATGAFALDELGALADRAEDAGAGRPDSARCSASLAPAAQAAARLRDAALALEARADAALAGRGAWPAGGADAVNAALLHAERLLLGPGLPGRPWFRHELYAPGLNTGYAAMPLPRLGQAVQDGDPRGWAAGVDPIAHALDAAAAELAKVK